MLKSCNREEALEELVSVYNYFEDVAPHILDLVEEGHTKFIRGYTTLRYDVKSGLFIFD